MDNRLNGLNPLSYQGVAPLSVPQLVFFNTDPTTTDSRNFAIGCIWINRSNENVWILVSLSKGVATWIKFTGANPNASSFPTDSGTAIPNAQGALTVHGGSNMNTSGSGSTVTVNLNNTVLITGSFTAVGEIATTNALFCTSVTNNTTGAPLNLIKTRGGGVVQSGDQLGALTFLGFDGTSNTIGAFITSVTSGTIGTGQVPADLEFWTAPNTVDMVSRRMLISSAGNVTINAADSGTTLTVSGTTNLAGAYITADPGSGVASTTGLTNTSNLTANGAGTFTIASKTANNLTSTGFVKIYVGTTAYWIPIFTTPSP